MKDSANNTIGKYVYDGNGKRIKKITEAEHVIFVYDGLGKLIGEYSTDGPTQTPMVHYTATDHLGSPRVITDAAGQVKSRRDFMPFGEELYVNVGNRTESLKYGSSADNVRQKFTGYERDNETQLDFAQARVYAMNLGRFQSADSHVNDTNPSDAASWNLYAYVRNNPLLFVDPTGMVMETDFVDRDTGKITPIDDGRDQVITASGKAIAKFEELWKARQKNQDADHVYYQSLSGFENSWHNLHLTGGQFRLLARTVYAESSGSYRESYGIVNVLENRAGADGTDLMTQVSDADGYGVYGVRSDKYSTEQGAAADQKRLDVHKAIARGIPGNDITGGAYFWDGRDFNKNARGNNSGYRERIAKGGYLFNHPSHDRWNQGSLRVKGTYTYQSTAVIGDTTFSKLYAPKKSWRY